MSAKQLTTRSEVADGHSCLSKHHSLRAILGIVLLCLLPFRMLHATSYGHVELAAMVDGVDLIVVAELTPTGETLNAKVGEVLKGSLPQGFELSTKISSYEADGKVIQYADFGGDARVKIADLISSKQRIFFLRKDGEGHFRTFRPDCMMEVDKRQRVSEVIAMAKDLTPYVMTSDYAGDVDLIYLLGDRFYALRVIAPAIPELERYMDKHREVFEEIPWQRTRLTLQFTYEESRKPSLQMELLEATGVLADFIRKVNAYGVFDSLQKGSKSKLPPTFSVTIDTNGPEKVGDLSFKDASKFLCKQLESKDADLVTAAFGALAKMMDPQAIQNAISMITYPNTRMRTQAAIILGYARDPVSIDSIISAVEFLPQQAPYGSPGHDQDLDALGDALGRAVRQINDPKAVPALKRVMYKGYAGSRLAIALANLGDESAFEPLLYHIRNPYVEHYPDELVNLIKRSNLAIEPWMNEGISSSDTAGKQRRAEKWIAWWDSHKTEFRIVRTWEEESKRAAR